MDIISILIGVALGAAVVFVVLNSRLVKARVERDAEVRAREGAEAAVEAARREGAEAVEQVRREGVEAVAVAKREGAEALAEARREGAEAVALAKKEAAEALEAQKKEAAEERDRQAKFVKDQVTAATEELLKLRAEDLQKTNSVQMETILKPLNENLEKMGEALTKTREVSAANKTSIEEQIKNMLEQTQKVGKSADDLTNALQKKNKIAGNWGEGLLTTLLESQGMEEGIHYTAQGALRDENGNILLHDESGKRMIPDVVLHLSEDRDVVIDSKVSLKDYVDWCNATSDEARAEALRALKESIKAHVKGLAAKDYSEYIVKPKVSADFVIMFVPLDGAVQLIMSEAPEIWSEAFGKRVYIASTQSLIAALKIIELTWRHIRQERNTEKILAEATKLVERVGQFYEEFEDFGDALDKAQGKYRKVMDKVKDGRQSILGAGRNLEDLGVRAKKALPRIEE